MKKYFLLYPAFVILIFSCVPRAKVVYLQDDRGIKDARTGVVVEGFQLKDFEYRLKPEDIVSVKVTTLTTTEYNFFAESERQIGGVANPLLSGYLIDKDGFI
ncbi:MAG: hypothetical protein M3512_18660, partial [Bacteroidota bacterium]|nr:hypothetical protein [Bacteroidota bacterium]